MVQRKLGIHEMGMLKESAMQWCSLCEGSFFSLKYFNYCNECRKLKARKTYQKNRHRVIQKTTQYYENNKEAKKSYDKLYFLKNSERKKQYSTEYYNTHRSSLMYICKARLSAARHRARVNNLAFDLTIEWVKERIENGLCEATLIPFNLIDKPPEGERFHPFAPSIDKINPKGGYTVDNCQMVVFLYNRMKSNIDPNMFNFIIENARNGLEKRDSLRS